MNPETAYIADRPMSLSEFEWTLIETALLHYGTHKAAFIVSNTDYQIATSAIDLAKRVRITNDSYTAIAED